LPVCWFRIHSVPYYPYYADYRFALVGATCLVLGLLNLSSTLYAIWRRSFDGLLFAVPIVAGLAFTHIMPDYTPHAVTLIADTEYLSDVRSSLIRWDKENYRFPATDAELGSVVGLPRTSRYRQDGNLLAYEFVVQTNAEGPRVASVSPRPGVIYYCVSKDLQQFWLTMTRLQFDMDSTAHVESAPGLPPEFWMSHGVSPRPKAK